MEKITAPFTLEQVAALNRWQNLGYVHPFTCKSEIGCGKRSQAPDREGKLFATTEGWVCPCGKYKQLWAHEGMLEKPPMPPSGFPVGT